MKMTITISDELYWSFQRTIAERRQIQKEAVERAISEYVKRSPISEDTDGAASIPRDILMQLVLVYGKRGESGGAARALQVLAQAAQQESAGDRPPAHQKTAEGDRAVQQADRGRKQRIG